MNIINLAAAAIVTASLTACATGPQKSDSGDSTTKAPAPELAAAPRPDDPKTGTEYHWLKNGKTHISVIKDMADGVAGGESSDGCQWKYMPFVFAPTIGWTNCNGYTGTRTITKSKGSPWPLQAGNKWSHSYRSSTSDGRPYSWKFKCGVLGAENVTVPAGKFDTYKIRCKDKWATSTFWFAPDYQTGEVVLRERASDNGTTRYELVKRIDG